MGADCMQSFHAPTDWSRDADPKVGVAGPASPSCERHKRTDQKRQLSGERDVHPANYADHAAQGQGFCPLPEPWASKMALGAAGLWLTTRARFARWRFALDVTRRRCALR